MDQLPTFIFVTCQSGAEHILKTEIARSYPFLRSAYARRGFVTFKFPEGAVPGLGFRLDAVFAQAWGFSLGKVVPNSRDEAARQAWELIAGAGVCPRWVHVWPRDGSPPGKSCPEEPWPSMVQEIHQALIGSAPDTLAAGLRECRQDRPAPRDCWVLDCVLVNEDEWWIGIHKVVSGETAYPGGKFPLVLPEHAVSRAYLKMEEALRWSQFPAPPGAQWAELGSAPGGASQALLDHGYEVLGVDPAAMHPSVLAHPKFTHLRRRTPQVPRRAFRKVHWLAADINTTPNYTLDAVESIVTCPEVNIHGMILTLKLPEWRLAENIPQYLERIRSWGFEVVRARHLWFNKQEICVAALMKPLPRKSSAISRKK